MDNQKSQAMDIAVPDVLSEPVSGVCMGAGLLLAASWPSAHMHAQQQQQQQQQQQMKQGAVLAWSLAQDQHGNITGATAATALDLQGTPVLGLEVTDDNMALLGFADGAVRLWDVQQGPQAVMDLGSHGNASPVRFVRVIDGGYITGGQGGDVHVWDPRAAGTPMHSVQLTDRLHAFDARSGIFTAGTADMGIHVYDMAAGNFAHQFRSTLNYQTRGMAISPDMQAFCFGSVAGKVSIEFFHEMTRQREQPIQGATYQSFIFKCHRQQKASSVRVFGVNSISFNSISTFITAGGDGSIAVWDKQNRMRTALFERFATPTQYTISCAAFGRASDAFVYAVSYDWSKGADHNVPTSGIFIHNTLYDEIKPVAQTR